MTNETMCVHKQSFCVVILRILEMKAPGLNKIKRKYKCLIHLKTERLPLEYLPLFHGLGLCYSADSLRGNLKKLLAITDI